MTGRRLKSPGEAILPGLASKASLSLRTKMTLIWGLCPLKEGLIAAVTSLCYALGGSRAHGGGGTHCSWSGLPHSHGHAGTCSLNSVKMRYPQRREAPLGKRMWKCPGRAAPACQRLLAHRLDGSLCPEGLQVSSWLEPRPVLSDPDSPGVTIGHSLGWEFAIPHRRQAPLVSPATFGFKGDKLPDVCLLGHNRKTGGALGRRDPTHQWLGAPRGGGAELPDSLAPAHSLPRRPEGTQTSMGLVWESLRMWPSAEPLATQKAGPDWSQDGLKDPGPAQGRPQASTSPREQCHHGTDGQPVPSPPHSKLQRCFSTLPAFLMKNLRSREAKHQGTRRGGTTMTPRSASRMWHRQTLEQDGQRAERQP